MTEKVRQSFWLLPLRPLHNSRVQDTRMGPTFAEFLLSSDVGNMTWKFTFVQLEMFQLTSGRSPLRSATLSVSYSFYSGVVTSVLNNLRYKSLQKHWLLIKLMGKTEHCGYSDESINKVTNQRNSE